MKLKWLFDDISQRYIYETGIVMGLEYGRRGEGR